MPEMMLREFAADWLARHTPSLREQSVRNYRTVLASYIIPLLGDVAMPCLTRRLIHDALNELRRRGLGEGTIRNVRARLSALCQDAIAADVLATNPLLGLKSPRYRRQHPPRVLSAVALEHYLATAQQLRPELHGVFCACAWAGLRIGEALALQAQDRGAHLLHVQRTVLQNGQVTGAPKNGEWRDVEIGPRLEAALAAIDAVLWLFPSPVTGGPRRYSPVWKAAKRIAREAGTLLVSPHDLRHTYFSSLVSQGVNLEWCRRQAGHSGIQITVDLYGRWMPLERPPALDHL